MNHYLQIVILALIQGFCELLPVSSSAHVIVAEKLMGLNASSPEMTFLLVMLHTGTMFAVIAYFWNSWRRDYFASKEAFIATAKQVIVATAATGIVGVILKLLIEKVAFHGRQHAEVEELFDNLPLIGTALASVGVLILVAGRGRAKGGQGVGLVAGVDTRQSLWIGVVQGLCLPFRGFSRSGSTISTALLLGVTREKAEKFSFALAVVLTPVVIAMEAKRLLVHHAASAVSTAVAPTVNLSAMLMPGLLGMVCSFVAGLLALQWLSRWLEHGRWQWFGYYCLVAAAAVFFISTRVG
jgi:undecaprenyl-diphosphatase